MQTCEYVMPFCISNEVFTRHHVESSEGPIIPFLKGLGLHESHFLTRNHAESKLNSCKPYKAFHEYSYNTISSHVLHSINKCFNTHDSSWTLGVHTTSLDLKDTRQVYLMTCLHSTCIKDKSIKQLVVASK